MTQLQGLNASRILVTGGAGVLGGRLASELADLGYDVTVIDSLCLGSSMINDRIGGQNHRRIDQHKSLTFIRADLSQPQSYSGKIRDCDTVFHLATLRRYPQKGDHVASLGLLRALREVKVRFLMLYSSAQVYGNASIVPTPETYSPLEPKTPYAIDRVKCERLVTDFAREKRIPMTILRFANIVGGEGFQGVVRDYFESLSSDPTKLRILGDGLQMRSYVHVDDCVNAIGLTAKNADESVQVYNVASEDAVNVNGVVQAIIEELGLTPPRAVYTGAYSGGGGWPGDPRIVFPDTRKIKALGWRASLQSKQAIQRSVRAMRQHEGELGGNRS